MNLKKDLKDTVNDVKDMFNEASHKSAAEAEHARRDLAGDTMTTSEKARSVANEATNTVQAGIDHAKVEARKEL